MTKQFVLVYCICLLLTACHQQSSNSRQAAGEKHAGKMYVEAKPFQTDSGWGYNIYVDQKLYIQQRFIPSVAGMQSFQTKEDALKVARLVIKKMDQEHRRPVISLQDLQQLDIETK